MGGIGIASVDYAKPAEESPQFQQTAPAPSPHRHDDRYNNKESSASRKRSRSRSRSRSRDRNRGHQQRDQDRSERSHTEDRGREHDSKRVRGSASDFESFHQKEHRRENNSRYSGSYSKSSSRDTDSHDRRDRSPSSRDYNDSRKSRDNERDRERDRDSRSRYRSRSRSPSRRTTSSSTRDSQGNQDRDRDRNRDDERSSRDDSRRDSRDSHRTNDRDRYSQDKEKNERERNSSRGSSDRHRDRDRTRSPSPRRGFSGPDADESARKRQSCPDDTPLRPSSIVERDDERRSRGDLDSYRDDTRSRHRSQSRPTNHRSRSRSKNRSRSRNRSDDKAQPKSAPPSAGDRRAAANAQLPSITSTALVSEKEAKPLAEPTLPTPTSQAPTSAILEQKSVPEKSSSTQVVSNASSPPSAPVQPVEELQARPAEPAAPVTSVPDAAVTSEDPMVVDSTPVVISAPEKAPTPSKTPAAKGPEKTPKGSSAKKSSTKKSDKTPEDKAAVLKMDESTTKKSASAKQSATVESSSASKKKNIKQDESVPGGATSTKKTKSEAQSEPSSVNASDVVAETESNQSARSSASSNGRFVASAMSAAKILAPPEPYVSVLDDDFTYLHPSLMPVTPPFEEHQSGDTQSAQKRRKLNSADDEDTGPLVYVIPVPTTPLKVGPFSLFNLIRQALLEANVCGGLTAETLKQVAAADPRIAQTLPVNLNMANTIHLALNFLQQDPLFGHSWVQCVTNPAAASQLPYDQLQWRWSRDETFQSSQDSMFDLEAAFWFALSRGLFTVNEAERVFNHGFDIGALEMAPRPYTPDQKSEYQTQEKRRYSEHKANSAFEVKIKGFPVTVLPSIGVNRTERDLKFLSSPTCPLAVSFRTILVDAIARVPGGVATLDDLVCFFCTSFYVSVPDASLDILKNEIESTLKQLDMLPDPPVKFCRELGLWVYRFRQRLKTDFEPYQPNYQDFPQDKVDIQVYTSPKVEGLRTIYWAPPESRRPVFPFLAPRRRVQDSEKQEATFRIIRDEQASQETVNERSLWLRDPKDTTSRAKAPKKPTKKVQVQKLPKNFQLYDGPRRSSQPGSRPRQSLETRSSASDTSENARNLSLQEDNEKMDVDVETPAPTAAAADPMNIELLFPIHKFVRSDRNNIFFGGETVYRSSSTDPCFLPDNMRPPVDALVSEQEWPMRTFHFDIESLMLLGDHALKSFNAAVDFSHLQFQRSAARHNASSHPLDYKPWWHQEATVFPAVQYGHGATANDETTAPSRPIVEVLDQASYPELELNHPDNPLRFSSNEKASVSTQRLVEPPSAVGYLHWLQDLESAVEEYLRFNDWRPEAGDPIKSVKRNDTPEIRDALMLIDPFVRHNRIASSVLPCNSVESHHTRRRWNLFSNPDVSKILLPISAVPPVEFARHRLPSNGSWRPIDLDDLYTVYQIDGESRFEEDNPKGKKRKSMTGDERESKAKSKSEKQTAKKQTNKKNETPKKKRKLAESDFSGSTGSSDESEEEKPKKKRKREDSDEPVKRKSIEMVYTPRMPPKGSSSRSRGANATVAGPETAPQLCCRVILANCRSKPVWPAAILSAEGYRIKNLHRYGKGEYIWPFAAGSHFKGETQWQDDFSIDYYVDEQILDDLMTGVVPDAELCREDDVDARAFLKNNRSLWVEALKAAKQFLTEFHVIMDQNASQDDRFSDLPRQLPGVPQVPPQSAPDAMEVDQDPQSTPKPVTTPKTKAKGTKSNSAKKAKAITKQTGSDEPKAPVDVSTTSVAVETSKMNLEDEMNIMAAPAVSLANQAPEATPTASETVAAPASSAKNARKPKIDSTAKSELSALVAQATAGKKSGAPPPTKKTKTK